MAGVALGHIHLHFAWQAWHLVTSTFHFACQAWHLVTSTLHFAWQAWHLVTSTLHFAWQAWHLTTSIVTLRGRRGTYGTGLALVARVVTRWRGGAAALCVAGVALRDIHLHFVWQAWHLVTSTFTLRGRHGTWSHPPFTLRARRGTYGTGLALVARVVTRWRGGAAALCVAGVALLDIHLHFAWQAWHLVTSTFTLRGRRGTW